MYSKFKERWLEVHATAIDESSNVDNDRVVSTNKKIPLWKRLNKDGFTSFTLAAKLGLTDMFSFLLDESKIVQWRYGPVSCVLYPLEELELASQQEVSIKLFNLSICLFLISSQYEDTSPTVLELIVQNAQAELIMHPRIVDLVGRKWNCFARRIFFWRFLLTLVYLSIFLITTILDQTRIETVKASCKNCLS